MSVLFWKDYMRAWVYVLFLLSGRQLDRVYWGNHCGLGICTETWEVPVLCKWDENLPGILVPFSRSLELPTRRHGRNELGREAKMIVRLKIP